MHEFKDRYASHEHALRTLELVSVFDDFMDSISVVADMGCGGGLDIEWFATLEDRSPEKKPYNYTCYAVDRDITQMSDILPKNITVFTEDFDTVTFPKSVDWIWSHDSFQFATNPLGTLAHWNSLMTVNGMLLMVVPQSMSHSYNRYATRTFNGNYFNYNACSLIYMLAVNGFDCRDSYFYKTANNPWIYLAVYKTAIPPMNPKNTTWYDLEEKGLLHDSIIASIRKFGYLRQEDIIMPWLDKNWYTVCD